MNKHLRIKQNVCFEQHQKCNYLCIHYKYENASSYTYHSYFI